MLVIPLDGTFDKTHETYLDTVEFFIAKNAESHHVIQIQCKCLHLRID